MCRVSVFNEDHCSLIAIGLSDDGKWVFNKACSMPWYHVVVHFSVKTSRFRAVFRDDRPDHGSTSTKQAVFLPQRFSMRDARPRPTSVLV